MRIARRFVSRAVPFAVAVPLMFAACSGGSEPDPPTATTLTVSPSSVSFETSGATATLSAVVRDQNGATMPLATVSWSSSNSGVATVDPSGVVTSVAPGTAQIRASSGGASGEATATVTIVPVELERVGDAARTGAAGEALGSSISVRAFDASGNPAPGADVAFEVRAGDGAVSPAQAQSGSDGVAQTSWTLGTVAGVANELRASLANGQGQAIDFTAESTPGAADSVRIEAGQNQSGPRNRALSGPIQLRVTDAFDNAIPGAPFEVSVTSGAGSVDTPSGQANAEGRATLRWTLGAALGRQTLEVQSGEALAVIEAVSTTTPTAVTVAAGDGQSGPVATPTEVAPAVLVTDEDDLPVPGVDVTFTVTSGGGTLAEAGDELVVRTDDDGVASVAWTLGTEAGSDNQELEARVGELEPATFTASAVAGPAASIESAAGEGQSGGVGLELDGALEVRVADEYDNPVEGADVAFAVTSGDGAVSPATAATGADGIASTRWTLGPDEGEQTASATLEGVGEVAFSATATLIPASMTATQGQGQTATVATAVAEAPAVEVLTATDIPVPGAVVTFSVTEGNGTVTAGGTTDSSVQVTTDSEGVATLDSWTLGTTAGSGAHEVTASVSGVDDVVFSASATAGPLDSWSKDSGDGQSGVIDTALDAPLVVRTVDAYGNPVSGVEVTFTTTDGSTSPTSATTNSSGRASTEWTLGSTEGAQELTASAVGLGDLTFEATAAAAPAGACVLQAVTSGYDIQLCFVEEVSSEIASAFTSAQARWQSIITGDLSNRNINLVADDCGTHPALSGTVDDLVIFVNVAPIDGPSGTLGFAGPCYIRFPSYHASIGTMTFDSADLEDMVDEGILEDVILHEMGHVIGIGTVWEDLDLLQNPVGSTPDPTADTHFNGPLAIQAFDDAGGAGRTVDSKVPVENAQGGAGTLDGHWRESTLNTELMTGFIDVGSGNPLSAITIQSLADMGYTVNVGQADSYTVFAPDGVAELDFERLIPLGNDILRLPLRLVDDQGQLVGILSPPR